MCAPSSDVMAETMVELGRAPGVRHGRALEPRSGRRAAAAGEEPASCDLLRHPARGRRGLRRVGLRQAHRAPGRVLRDRGPRCDESADRAVGRQRRSRARPGVDRPGRHAGPRPGRLPGGRLWQPPSARSRVWASRCCTTSRHAELVKPRLQERDPRARRVAPDLPRRGADARARPRRTAKAGSPDGTHRRAARSPRPRESLDQAALDAACAKAKRPRHRRGGSRRALRHARDHGSLRNRSTPR